MTAPTSTGPDRTERAQPPIRWPRPDGTTLTTLVLWLGGLVVALLVPAAIVPPGSQSAEPSKVWTAFAVTCVGAAVTMGATVFHLRRKHDSAVLILGLVPAFSAVVGGIIFATTILTKQ